MTRARSADKRPTRNHTSERDRDHQETRKAAPQTKESANTNSVTAAVRSVIAQGNKKAKRGERIPLRKRPNGWVTRGKWNIHDMAYYLNSAVFLCVRIIQLAALAVSRRQWQTRSSHKWFHSMCVMQLLLRCTNTLSCPPNDHYSPRWKLYHWMSPRIVHPGMWEKQLLGTNLFVQLSSFGSPFCQWTGISFPDVSCFVRIGALY